MFEELNGLCIEREVTKMLIVEEMDGVFVEVEGEGLEEGDIIGEHFLIREIQLQDYDGVDVVVGEKIVCQV